MSGGSERPKMLGDSFEVERDGERITVWNHLTISEEHYVTAGSVESHHRVVAGDHPNGESPDYITPEMQEQLHSLDIYPSAEVVDPNDDEVTIL